MGIRKVIGLNTIVMVIYGRKETIRTAGETIIGLVIMKMDP